MNSHQRRSIRRYWRYGHIIEYDDPLVYLQVRSWCEDQFGKIGYRWGNCKWNPDFCFRHEKDYVLFVMRWS